MSRPQTLTLLVNAAFDEIGLPNTASVIGNQDQTVRRALAAVNATGLDLAKKDPPWTILIKEYEFTTQENVQNYDLPSDYGWMIDSTVWDRSNYWQVRGSLTPQQWQVIKSGLVQTARVSSNFRLKQAQFGTIFQPWKQFYIDPLPAEGIPLVFEYVSDGWVYSANQTTFRNRYEIDTDLSLFDSSLMVKGIIWRLKRSIGLPYQSELQEFRDTLGRDGGQDAAPPVLNVSESHWRLPAGNTPDTGFGSP